MSRCHCLCASATGATEISSVLLTSSTPACNFTYVWLGSCKLPWWTLAPIYCHFHHVLPLPPCTATSTMYCHSPHVLQGWDLFSCDCFGTVLHWDLRTHTTQGRWDFGPYAINSIAPDPAGEQMNHHTVSTNDQLAVVLTQTLKTVIDAQNDQ